jgi:hypothetical protein
MTMIMTLIAIAVLIIWGVTATLLFVRERMINLHERQSQPVPAYTVQRIKQTDHGDQAIVSVRFGASRLSIKQEGFGPSNGDGYFVFDEAEIELARDGETSSRVYVADIMCEDLLEMRDTLNDIFPAPGKLDDVPSQSILNSTNLGKDRRVRQ